MVVLELASLGGFYYSVLLWFPFYFTYIGYEEYSNYLSIICPLISFGGSLAFGYLLSFCKSINHWIMSAFLISAIVVHYWMT